MGKIITLDENSPSVKYLRKKDKRLFRVIRMVGPITYEPHDEAFPFLVHEIVEQMLSVKAGQKIYARLEALCNNNVTPEVVASLSEEEIREAGMSPWLMFMIGCPSLWPNMRCARI